MSERQQQLFVAGLPGAGKTTFLAALWHVVESEEVDGAMRLVRLVGESTYLNRIRSLWIDAKELERTKLADEANLRMCLVTAANEEVDLWIPDLSGEAFEAQWTDRIAPNDYCRFVRESSGGLFFVHPDVKEEHLIADIAGLVPQAAATPTDASPTAQQASAPATHVPWDARFAPTQIQLVDLLQFVLAIRSNAPLRLSIVISAWDLVAENISPEKWVESHLPLMHQFLKANSAVFDARFFGVSAQGGKLDDPAALDGMRARIKPSDRIRISDGDGNAHDITAPLKWALG